MSTSLNNTNETIEAAASAAGGAPAESPAISVNPSPIDVDNDARESAAKRTRPKIEAEDTSSYMGSKRNKVRGNIRGADKYKGKRSGPWGPGTRNAEDAAKSAAEPGRQQNSSRGRRGEERLVHPSVRSLL